MKRGANAFLLLVLFRQDPYAPLELLKAMTLNEEKWPDCSATWYGNPRSAWAIGNI